MARRFFKLAILAATLFTSGCALVTPDRIHYTFQPHDLREGAAQSETAPATISTSPVIDRAEIIGVALSGGGSRASVFGAAALEVLAEKGILEETTYISSVSGGGFPAIYYALNKPQPCAAGDNETPCTSESFATFKLAMRHNFLSDMTFHQLGKPGRITSSTRRLSSLQDALDEEIINGATFSDLPASPVLLINGARYDDGRRFVFSNMAIPEEAESDIERFSHITLRSASFSQPGCTRATPGDFSVALAIAISAGFPPLLGPASLEMPTDCGGSQMQYWHLGDGGILDNTGVETIEDFALRASHNGPKAERVVIISIDSGKSTPSETMMQQRNLKLWTTDPGRVVEIVGFRAKAYQDLALHYINSMMGVPVTIISMRYTDAEISSWPESCSDKSGGTEAIHAHLLTIPTNLKITDCDADLMELAARDIVERRLRENKSVLESVGISW